VSKIECLGDSFRTAKGRGLDGVEEISRQSVRAMSRDPVAHFATPGGPELAIVAACPAAAPSANVALRSLIHRCQFTDVHAFSERAVETLTVNNGISGDN
jgi:hypothetical protein